MRVQQELHATNANQFTKIVDELTGVCPRDLLEKTRYETLNKQSKGLFHFLRVY